MDEEKSFDTQEEEMSMKVVLALYYGALLQGILAWLFLSNYCYYHSVSIVIMYSSSVSFFLY